MQSTAPEFYLESVDDVEPAPDEDDYVFDLEVSEVGSSGTAVTESLATTRDATVSWAEWTPEPGVLEENTSYEVRYRAMNGTVAGPWTSSPTVTVIPLAPEPALDFPADEQLLGSTPTLTASIPGYQSGEFAEITFRVESNWEFGAPETVAEEWTTVDGSGSGSFSPTLLSGGATEGVFRWQARYYSESLGTSAWTGFRTFSIGSKPSAVQSLFVYANRQTVEAYWDWPQYSYVAPVEEFDVTLSPGGYKLTVPYSSAQFTDIPFGDYTLTVVPRNLLGEGPASVSTVSVTQSPATSPINLGATAKKRAVELSWQPPEDDGGSPILNYRVELTSCATYQWGEVAVTSDTHAVIDNLDTCYQSVRVTAINAIGDGSPAYNGFQPFAEPSAPTRTSVRAGDGFVDVFWDQPDTDNGAPVERYVITASPGGASVDIPASYGQHSLQFDDLTNGTAYTFSVAAVNAAGQGAAVDTVPSTPIDDATDSDQDGVLDVVEIRVGSDILLGDSDNDGLSDDVEISLLSGHTSPVTPDSDDDGVPDADADADLDGLTNGAEAAGGTKPANSDTDTDQIDDAAEITAGTDPTRPDSDQDGLTDGFEINSNLNPLASDSDQDGIPDEESILTATISPTKTLDLEPGQQTTPPAAAVLPKTTATITGRAQAVSTYYVAAGSADHMPGALTATAIVGTTDRIGTAGVIPTIQSVDLGYSSLVAATRLSNLAPVIWNQQTSSWEFASNNVAVSTATRTFSISSPILGLTYAVVDLTEWAANARQCDRANNQPAPLNVEVILDATGSVEDLDPSNERLTALRAVIGSLKPGDQVNIRAFGVVDVIYSFAAPSFFNADNPELIPNISLTRPNDDLLRGATSIEEALAVLDAAGNLGYFDDDGLTKIDAENAYKGVNGPFSQADPFPAESNPLDSGITVPECRERVKILVTDGEFKPLLDGDDTSDFPSGYTRFIDTDIPVHVLDVGSTNSDASDWLIDLADSSGGTYSYIPTATDLASWISDVTPAPPLPGTDFTTDSDGDGLTDWVETTGIISTTNIRQEGPRRYYSDPDEVDTDDDGLTDGEEAGAAYTPPQASLNWVSSRPVNAYSVISNPGLKDSDVDGLEDIAEIDLGGNPLDSDPDFDGLDDGDEEDWGVVATLSDTDLDGFSDGFEVDNQVLGYDPWARNPAIDPNQYLNDLALGMFCGDIEYCQRANDAWLIGNIISGVLVFGDVRDGIAQFLRGDLIASTISLASIVPIGKLVGNGSKVAKFLHRYTTPEGEAVGLRAIRDLNPQDYVARIADVNPALVTALRASAMSDASIKKLVDANGITRLRNLLALPPTLRRVAQYPPGIRPSFMATGKAGEDTMQKIVGIFPQKQQRITIADPGFFARVRYPDGIKKIGEDDAGVDVLRFLESKVGFSNSIFARTQALKDGRLLADDVAQDIEWHFFASARTGKIGPSDSLLQILQDQGIKIVIHLPAP